MPDSVSASYRGYRRQALYVLWRLLTDKNSDSRSYRPEGGEDLDVFDGTRLVEAVQVKDHSAPLGLSAFNPSSPDGFFARMNARRQLHPGCRHLIVSFGPIGPELGAAFANPGPQRNAVAEKLSNNNPMLANSEAQALLSELKEAVIHPEEQQLQRAIGAVLETGMAGMHADTALDLLMFWVFVASERAQPLTRAGLLLQIQRIGAYLGALRSYHTEWTVAVTPLQASSLSQAERDALCDDYRRGVQAAWRHILADADCRRPGRLAQIHEKLGRHPGVVIRGASGQGKSSLALRYMHDYCAEGLRFYVRFVDGRGHAVRIANALQDHIAALRLNAVVLLDVSPSDSGWMELVKDLTTSGIKVLVTVREEDFRRLGTPSGDLRLADLELDAITRNEGAAIYDALSADGRRTLHLDFEEAWARFTALDSGPLMEFTHIVTEGQSMATTIAAQVFRLQTDASAGQGAVTDRHLRLLALASIGNAAECRVSVAGLCSSVGLAELTAPLALLADEYFLRISTSGQESVVAPLHALRSQAIADALLRDRPEMWIELAIQCLPLIVEADLERFLLSAFSRRPQHSKALSASLATLQPRSWLHAAAAARAMLWEGINRYELENHSTIAAAIAEHSDSWWLLCDVFIASESSAHAQLRKTVADVTHRDEAELPHVALTDKQRAFEPLRCWAECAKPPLRAPRATDWPHIGDLSFLLGTQHIAGALRQAVEAALPEGLPTDLSVSELGRFVAGRASLGDKAFEAWHRKNRNGLIDSFLQATGSIAVVDSKDAATVLFPVRIADEGTGDDPNAHDFHAQAMNRVALLRQLLPYTATIGSQGVGIEILRALIPHDPTTKAIPIEHLPLRSAVHPNATFLNLTRYRCQRADSWREYIDSIVAFRRAACATFRGLHRAWSQFLERSKITSTDMRRMPGAELTALQKMRVPLFPRTAVDEWGFVSETNEKHEFADPARVPLLANLGRFAKWCKTWQEYESCVERVAQNVVGATVSHLGSKNFTGDGTVEQSSRLLVVNLGFAWQALDEMQEEFRRCFGRQEVAKALDELERHERSTFRHLWPVAFAFVFAPAAQRRDAASTLETELRERRRTFLRVLRTEVTSAMSGKGTVTIAEGPFRIGGRGCLAVICNHTNAITMEHLRPEVVRAIWRAARSGQWRDIEYTGLVVEWPRVLVVHILRGQALSSTGAFISLASLFRTVEFTVAAHHTIETPIATSDYARLHCPLCDSPLVPLVAGFRAALLAFSLTMLRYPSLAEAAVKYTLDNAAIERALGLYLPELARARVNAVRSYEDLIGFLHTWRRESAARALQVDRWLDRLDHLSRALLIPNGDGSLRAQDFAQWAAHFEVQSTELASVATAMVEAAVGAECEDSGQHRTASHT